MGLVGAVRSVAEVCEVAVGVAGVFARLVVKKVAWKVYEKSSVVPTEKHLRKVSKKCQRIS